MPAREDARADTASVAVYQEYFNPILVALREHGGAMPIEVMERKVEALMSLAPAILAVPHDEAKPDRSEVGYRMAWARTYLKKAGMLDNPTSGTWTLTDKGRTAGTIDPYAVARVIAQAAKSPDSETDVVELLPDTSVLENAAAGDIPVAAWLDALNKRVVQHVGRDARHLQVGHSYLMVDGLPVHELSRFIEIVRDDIIPLLEERSHPLRCARPSSNGERIRTVCVLSKAG